MKQWAKSHLLGPVFIALNEALGSLITGNLPARWIFRAFAYVVPIADIRVRGVKIKVIVPFHHLGNYDALRHWEAREPETLDWIDSMNAGDILADVGSSTGTESLYAAKKENGPSQILAFDSGLSDSLVLCHNLGLNNMSNVHLYISELSDSSGWSQITDVSNYFALKRQEQRVNLRYRTWSTSVDDVIESPP